jgi:hypothetical protein
MLKTNHQFILQESTSGVKKLIELKELHLLVRPENNLTWIFWLC